MIVLATKQEAREAAAEWRRSGAKIGAAPTMGALHEGHLSLIDIAKRRCDVAIASIFVNPIQFSPAEDFSAYPRNLEKDLEMLAARGCEAVFTPDASEMSPAPAVRC